MPKASIITAILKAKQQSIAEVEKALGYANSGLRKAIERNSDLKSDKIDKLLSHYPDLNPGWVYRGEGDMLIDDTALPTPEGWSNATDLGRPVGIHTSKSGNEFVELSGGTYMMYTRLVPKKAHAGYMVGWGDEEFLGDLPIHPVVVRELHKGTYRTFECAGESMNDGTEQAIKEGDLITGRQISRSLWKTKFHTKKYPDYIIVHRNEGIVCKRIIAHDTDAGIITCHSLNSDKGKYPDFSLRLDDCLQIFNIVIVTKPR